MHWVRPYSGEGLSDKKSKGLNNELGLGVGADYLWCLQGVQFLDVA